jgi:hypothetical protein
VTEKKRFPEDIYKPDTGHFDRSRLIDFEFVRHPPTASAESAVVGEKLKDGKTAKAYAAGAISAFAFAFAVFQFLSDGPLLLPISIFVFCFFQALIELRKA